VGAHKRSTKEALNMIFVILLSFAVLVLPLIFFLAAAITESIHSTQKGTAFFFRMAEIAAGVIFFAVHYLYWGVTRISSSSLSWTMVCISLLLGGLSLVSKYESRVAFAICAARQCVLGFLVVLQRRLSSVKDTHLRSWREFTCLIKAAFIRHVLESNRLPARPR
jgi:hypothetical protein